MLIRHMLLFSQFYSRNLTTDSPYPEICVSMVQGYSDGFRSPAVQATRHLILCLAGGFIQQLLSSICEPHPRSARKTTS